MNAKFLEAITAVCKKSEVDIHLRDIVEVSDYEDEIVMWVRNDQEMFEFIIHAAIYENEVIQMSIKGVKDSPYSCDSYTASYNLKDKTIQYR